MPTLIRTAAVRLGVPADKIVEVEGFGPQVAIVAAARAEVAVASAL